MSEVVPVIDIRELGGAAALAAIHEACRDWGFFQVTAHGIEQAVIDEIDRRARLLRPPTAVLHVEEDDRPPIDMDSSAP